MMKSSLGIIQKKMYKVPTPISYHNVLWIYFGFYNTLLFQNVHKKNI